MGSVLVIDVRSGGGGGGGGGERWAAEGGGGGGGAEGTEAQVYLSGLEIVQGTAAP
jgi:hypothetical protein